MSWFKKPVKVKCQNKEEVGKILSYLRFEEGLVSLNRQHYPVTAVMAMQYWENPEEVMYFEVEVPYHTYKKLREAFIEKESFDEILQMRPIAEIMLDREAL